MSGWPPKTAKSRTPTIRGQDFDYPTLASQYPDLHIRNCSKGNIYEIAKGLKDPQCTMADVQTFFNPFLGVPRGSQCAPESSAFSAEAWLTNLKGFIAQQPPDGALPLDHGRFGVCFADLGAYGSSSSTDYQQTVGNILLRAAGLFTRPSGNNKQQVQILDDFVGIIRAGEMLLVLGRPGSGCSTFLKTISGHTEGFKTTGHIFYQPLAKTKRGTTSIKSDDVLSQFHGEIIYMAENDVHFPSMTVRETLLFAAKARAPTDNFLPGVTQNMYAEHMVDGIMATFSLGSAKDTKLGGPTIKGCSGGERKRVSIAEATLSGASLQVRSPLI